MTDSMLTRKLLIVALIKLVILFALWWFFVKDYRVNIDVNSDSNMLNMSHISQHK